MSSFNPSLHKPRLNILRVRIDLTGAPRYDKPFEDLVPASRATRLVADSRRFLFVSILKKSAPAKIRIWLKDTTQNGFDVADKRYTFWGYTESQLKEGNVIFFEEDAVWTVASLKAALGDLESVYLEHGYGKYCARLGLSFSSTVEAFEVADHEMLEIPDLVADDESITSDGCGMIRDSFASRVCEAIEVAPDTSVFQIRRGGVKGILVRYPDETFDRICSRGRVRGKIAIRPSMKKYSGGPTMLEIQDVSRPPRNARLNRMFIPLLMTLGIPRSVFEELLQVQIATLEEILTNREKALACVDGELDKDGTAFDQELYEMLLAGFDTSEPHLECLLKRFQKRSFDALKEKLNIPVPESAYVYGVVDELGVLEEGEVYINLPYRGGPQVGDFVVSRNPAYSPSDLRRLRGVNKPRLSHLTNCIVFAGKGRHSEPDNMGNGDLDGDQYFVLMRKLLIPSEEACNAHPPPLRTPAPPSGVASIAISYSSSSSSSSGQYTVSRSSRATDTKMQTDAVELFMALRCNFLIGRLSKAWLADVGNTRAMSDAWFCKELAPLIEQALDLTKSKNSIMQSKGIEFAFQKLLELKARPMDCDDDGALRWENPIERLRALVPVLTRERQTHFRCDPDLVLREIAPPAEWDALAKEAVVAMQRFNTRLRAAIEFDNEMAEERGSAWRGNSGEREESKTVFVKQDMIDFHFGGVTNILTDQRPRMLKASVWYCVGYEQKKEAFAWLGLRWLSKIKADRKGSPSISVGAVSAPLTPGTVTTVNSRRLGRQPASMDPGTSSILVCSAPTQTTPAQTRRIPARRPTPLEDARPDVTPQHTYAGPPRAVRNPPSLLLPVSVSSRPRHPLLTAAVSDETDTEDDSDGTVQSYPKYPDPRTRTNYTPVPLSALSSRTLIEDTNPRVLVPLRSTSAVSSVPITSSITTSAISSTSSVVSRSDPFGKPRQPVATDVGLCPMAVADHTWRVKHANASVRTYLCTECRMTVKEKKDIVTSRWLPQN